MATVATFKKSGNECTGEIVALNVQAENARIVPETNQTGENAPSHRVLVGRADIGAAWSKQPNEGRGRPGRGRPGRGARTLVRAAQPLATRRTGAV
ncbi:MAG: DUF736 family protein, partial [Kiloniellales bacterium]|nr:DUF736 family protein [Kiloniellales bacterium]